MLRLRLENLGFSEVRLGSFYIELLRPNFGSMWPDFVSFYSVNFRTGLNTSPASIIVKMEETEPRIHCK